MMAIIEVKTGNPLLNKVFVVSGGLIDMQLSLQNGDESR